MFLKRMSRTVVSGALGISARPRHPIAVRAPPDAARRAARVDGRLEGDRVPAPLPRLLSLQAALDHRRSECSRRRGWSWPGRPIRQSGRPASLLKNALDRDGASRCAGSGGAPLGGAGHGGLSGLVLPLEQACNRRPSRKSTSSSLVPRHLRHPSNASPLGQVRAVAALLASCGGSLGEARAAEQATNPEASHLDKDRPRARSGEPHELRGGTRLAAVNARRRARDVHQHPHVAVVVDPRPHRLASMSAAPRRCRSPSRCARQSARALVPAFRLGHRARQARRTPSRRSVTCEASEKAPVRNWSAGGHEHLAAADALAAATAALARRCSAHRGEAGRGAEVEDH